MMPKGFQNIDADLARRGVFFQDELRQRIQGYVEEWADKYYRLEDGGGHVHYLPKASVLLDVVKWFADFPRLRCDALFIPPRRPRRTDKSMLAAQFSDAEVFLFSRLRLLDAAVSFHFYDRTGVAEHTARLPSQACMRTINFDEMTESFDGYRIGRPACAISKRPFDYVKSNDEDRVDLSEIDVVYTWVDSSDPAWQAKFSEFVGPRTQTSRGSEMRYLSRDELRYSIRSILKFAPWVRNIFIVTDNQRPKWFRENSRVKIVDHREIFPDTTVLPVFNSHAIESCLHRIPGLSERFIYFNDDVFLGRPCTPLDFFSQDGRAKFYFSGHLSFNPEWVANGDLPTDHAFVNTIRIIQSRFGFTPIAKVQHTPHPMLRSVMARIEFENDRQFQKTRAARLRSEADVNMTGNLANYYYLGLGVGTWPDQGPSVYRYVDTGRVRNMKTLHRLFTRPVKFFCLNLTYHEEISFKRQAVLLRLLFAVMFPKKGSHERGSLVGSLLRLFNKRNGALV